MNEPNVAQPSSKAPINSVYPLPQQAPPLSNVNQTEPYATPGSQLQPGVAGAVYPPPPPYVISGTQPQPGTVVVTSVSSAAIVRNSCLSTPACVLCPSCHNQVITRITHSAGLLAWAICCGLVLFGCGLGCCLIPFCVDSCLDVNHFCPHCNHLIHKYKQL
uniref:Lipopolysaccharide-induced tumor necrosis factor-alpha factor homolog n=1 Tax=Geotrypetes seraphini TaxID=260995 RepID=A0A6P8P657_GEOSA|nr:lipopolysaccharide-induced tumor necrosis factor-alpha factor homolog [Geotrypetes seraphini]